MFKKRKEKKLITMQALQDVWSAQEKGFDDAIDQAMLIKDPVDKLIALQAVADDVKKVINGEKTDVYLAAKSKEGKFSYGAIGSVPIAIGLTLAGTFVFPPLAIAGLGLLVAGPFGGLGLAETLPKAGQKKAEALMEARWDHLQAQINMIGSVVAAMSDECAVEVVTSPKNGDLRKASYSLAAHFDSAAGGQLVAEKKAALEGVKPAPEAPAAATEEAPAARPRSAKKKAGAGLDAIIALGGRS